MTHIVSEQCIVPTCSSIDWGIHVHKKYYVVLGVFVQVRPKFLQCVTASCFYTAAKLEERAEVCTYMYIVGTCSCT